MRSLIFTSRNRKEITRDPFTIIFGIGLPVILILLMTFIQKSMKQAMPVSLFHIANFTPAMAVFSFSFISLFSGMLIAKDRSSSFLMRLFAAPMGAADYIIGYSLPLIPVAFVQTIACFAAAALFGLEVNMNMLLTIAVLVPVAILFIGFGILLGTLFTDKQVGGISSILVNVAAWLSGTWFDLEMIGGAFRTICYLLPFAHSVDAAKAALSGDYGAILPHLVWVIVYAVIIFTLAVFSFKRKMNSENA